jgi:hypothetical protein
MAGDCPKVQYLQKYQEKGVSKTCYFVPAENTRPNLTTRHNKKIYQIPNQCELPASQIREIK